MNFPFQCGGFKAFALVFRLPLWELKPTKHNYKSPSGEPHGWCLCIHGNTATISRCWILWMCSLRILIALWFWYSVAVRIPLSIMTLEKGPGDSWVSSALSAPCFGRFQLEARQQSRIRWTAPTWSCTTGAFRMQTGRREMTESISVTGFSFMEMSGGLEGEINAWQNEGKSYSLDFCSWSRYIISDTWLGSRTDVGTRMCKFSVWGWLPLARVREPMEIQSLLLLPGRCQPRSVMA